MNRSFGRYIIVGLLGAISHISTLTFLVEMLNISPIIGSITGFLVALSLSYWLNAQWTFDQAPQKHRQAIVRYIVVSVMGLCLNTFIMISLVNGLGVWYLIGQSIAAIVVPLHNFLLNFYWTFKTK